MKKILCILLAALMVLLSAACANTETPDGETTGNTPVSNEIDTEGERAPEFPEVDYQGSEFRIVGKKQEVEKLITSDFDGSALNDAIYEANSAVANRFKIKFKMMEMADDKNTTVIQGYIMSGTDEYDLAYLHDCTSATMSLNGWFMNVYDMPYMDPTAPWWPQFTVDSMTLNGKMFHFTNFSSYQVMNAARAVFFNYDLLDEYSIESPYELVRNGTWTLEKLQEMTKGIYVDKNGNSKQDEGDIVGFTAFGYPYGWLESFGIEAYRKVAPDSAEIELDIMNNNSLELIDILHHWFRSGDLGVLVNFDVSGEVGNTMFSEGRSVFTVARVGILAKLCVETGLEFGIVPMPKVNAAQEHYYAGSNDCLFTIPTSISDPQRVGMVLEAMAYEGHRYILPAYCENTLKTRFATDTECSEMMTKVFESQVVSFAYLFANSVPMGLQFRWIYDTITNNNPASYYKRNSKKENNMIDKITTFYSN